MLMGRLSRKWGRNLLSVLAIAVSFAMLLSLSSIALGLHMASEERTKESPRDIVISSQGLIPTIEDSHSRAIELQNDENFSAVMPLLTLLGKLASFDSNGPIPSVSADEMIVDNISTDRLAESESVGMVGVVPEMAERFMKDENELFIRSEVLRIDGWFEEKGDPFHDSGYVKGWTGEILLDKALMKRLEVDLGERVAYINRSGAVAGVFLVKGRISTSLLGEGISSDLLGGIAMVHLGELQFVSGYHSLEVPDGMIGDLSTALYMDLEEDKKDKETQRSIKLDLEKRFPGLRVTSKEERLYRIDEEMMILELFSVGVAATSLFIGILFLSSIMMIDVEDRRVEIAIMRAIGISKRTVFLQVLGDALILSMIGGLLGFLPGIMGSRLLDNYLRDLYGVDIYFSRFTPLLIVASISFLIIVSLIFSLIPALRGTSIDLNRGLGDYYNR